MDLVVVAACIAMAYAGQAAHRSRGGRVLFCGVSGLVAISAIRFLLKEWDWRLLMVFALPVLFGVLGWWIAAMGDRRRRARAPAPSTSGPPAPSPPATS